jgi:hypothetical protein
MQQAPRDAACSPKTPSSSVPRAQPTPRHSMSPAMPRSVAGQWTPSPARVQFHVHPLHLAVWGYHLLQGRPHMRTAYARHEQQFNTNAYRILSSCLLQGAVRRTSSMRQRTPPAPSPLGPALLGTTLTPQQARAAASTAAGGDRLHPVFDWQVGSEVCRCVRCNDRLQSTHPQVCAAGFG